MAYRSFVLPRWSRLESQPGGPRPSTSSGPELLIVCVHTYHSPAARLKARTETSKPCTAGMGCFDVSCRLLVQAAPCSRATIQLTGLEVLSQMDESLSSASSVYLVPITTTLLVPPSVEQSRSTSGQGWGRVFGTMRRLKLSEKARPRASHAAWV